MAEDWIQNLPICCFATNPSVAFTHILLQIQPRQRAVATPVPSNNAMRVHGNALYRNSYEVHENPLHTVAQVRARLVCVCASAACTSVRYLHS